MRFLLPFSLILTTSVHASTAMTSWYPGIHGMTTAAKYLPCGTTLLVWNAKDRHSKRHRLIVRDYGPFVGSRKFDLSPQAFQKVFGSRRKGVCLMGYKVLHRAPKCRIHRHDGSY